MLFSVSVAVDAGTIRSPRETEKNEIGYKKPAPLCNVSHFPVLGGDHWCAWSEGERLSLFCSVMRSSPFLYSVFQHIPHGGVASLSGVTRHHFTAVIQDVNPTDEICQQEAKTARTVVWRLLFSSFNPQELKFSNTSLHLGVVTKAALGFLEWLLWGNVFVQEGLSPLFCCA